MAFTTGTAKEEIVIVYRVKQREIYKMEQANILNMYQTNVSVESAFFCASRKNEVKSSKFPLSYSPIKKQMEATMAFDEKKTGFSGRN